MQEAKLSNVGAVFLRRNSTKSRWAMRILESSTSSYMMDLRQMKKYIGTMLPTRHIHLIVALLLTALVCPAHGGISWGTFLGADWADAEGELSM